MPWPCHLTFAFFHASKSVSSPAVHSDSGVLWWSHFFIHCHITTQKFGFIMMKQLEILLRIIKSLFLIDCELAQHPFWTEVSHTQIFSHNMQTLSFNIFRVLAITTNFTFKLSKIILLASFVFVGNASSGRSFRCPLRLV